MKVNIKPSAYIFFTILLFLVPFSWLFGWLIAVAFHELCHYIAVRLCGGEVYSLELDPTGASMQCSTMSAGKALLCVLIGPLGGLLPVLLGSAFPQLALCSFLLSGYNLLPILPLDGGRALNILLGDDKVFAVVQWTVLILLTIILLYFAFLLHFILLPLAIICGLWFRSGKIPCKDSVYKLQ